MARPALGSWFKFRCRWYVVSKQGREEAGLAVRSGVEFF